MSILLGFLQLAVALAGLYVSIYIVLKKKYEKLSEQHLYTKQNRIKKYKIEESVSLLNTIYIIIALVLISLYFSPFKGFFQFFKGNEFNTTLGKKIYIVSSSISALILTFCIVMYLGHIKIRNRIYHCVFCAFTYIYSIIVMLKLNQFALTYYIKSNEESLTNMYLNIFVTHILMDWILSIVYMLSFLGYFVFIDFLHNKFTNET